MSVTVPTYKPGVKTAKLRVHTHTRQLDDCKLYKLPPEKKRKNYSSSEDDQCSKTVLKTTHLHIDINLMDQNWINNNFTYGIFNLVDVTKNVKLKLWYLA